MDRERGREREWGYGRKKRASNIQADSQTVGKEHEATKQQINYALGNKQKTSFIRLSGFGGAGPLYLQTKTSATILINGVNATVYW